jgi:prepilin-type N-terminal cleavage/methylation domain-containing protein
MTKNRPGGPTGAPPAGTRFRGFTLIELALVLTITAILMTLAVVTYHHFVNKARFTQAQVTLKHLQKTELIYFSDNNRYTDNVVLLDFDPMKYNYYVISVTLTDNGMNFRGDATGIGAMAGDLWHIDRDGPPIQDNAAKAKF